MIFNFSVYLRKLQEKKLASSWRGQRRVIRAVSNHIHQVADLRNEMIADVYVWRLKLYCDIQLNAGTVMPSFLSSEI